MCAVRKNLLSCRLTLSHTRKEVIVRKTETAHLGSVGSFERFLYVFYALRAFDLSILRFVLLQICGDNNSTIIKRFSLTSFCLHFFL